MIFESLRVYIHRHLILFLDISKEKWEKMLLTNNWNTIELRDNRYNQILHLVSAANGAEEFYTTEVGVWYGVFLVNLIIFVILGPRLSLRRR